ncbi:ABC transporter ATP-binding protein [Microbacterium sp.]|uniref:ABC transporter ATP-binding protein n=1 Tax=Microbacterium sp. TaxID=51671 RepID=UPI0028117F90|nr:ABC transporter ATP-binding protein [Microbacterium sp.]
MSAVTDAGRDGASLAVELDGVSKDYAGLTALHAATLTIADGEFVAIVGPSGSGKSTLLQLIGTLDRPSTGKIRIHGHDVARLDDRALAALRARHVGFIFQQFHLSPGMPAVDNVAEGMLYQGIPLAERRRRATAALERVGLGHRVRHRPHELSGGERQRVAIARAIATRPSLLLADEPTGNLDSKSGAGVMALLAGLHAEGTTLVVITHDADIAARAPGRIRLKDGKVIE